MIFLPPLVCSTHRWGLFGGLPAASAAGLLLFGIWLISARAVVADPGPLARGLAAVEQGRLEVAGGTAARLTDSLDRSLLRWRLLTRWPERASFEALAEFLDTHPGWPGEEALLSAAETALPVGLPDDELLSWFERCPPRSGAAALRQARALQRRGRDEEAIEAARRAWRELDMVPPWDAVLLAEFGSFLRPVDHRIRVEKLLRAGAGEMALAALSDAAAADAIQPSHRHLLEVRARLALLQEEGEAAALDLPESLLFSSGLVFDLAWYRQQVDPTDAAADLLYPSPPIMAREAEDRWPVRRSAAQRLLRQGQAEIAYRIASQHGLAPGTALDEAEFLAGWIALRHLNASDQGYAHFDALFHFGSSAASAARGAFWAGEALRASGREDWAEQWFRVAGQYGGVFYGLLGALRADTEPQAQLAAIDTPDEAAVSRFEAQSLVQALRRLHAAGRRDLLPAFFRALRAEELGRQDFYLVGRLAHSLGRPDEAIRTGRVALGQGWTFPDLLYPTPRLALPADRRRPLVLALIRQESAFDPRAVSSAGAMGLMQLMPGTAADMAALLGEPFDLNRLTGDPDYNLRLGRAYLQAMLDRYEDFLPLALAAYNAGPGRVDTWLERHGDPRRGEIATVDWIELIPFEETRHYVPAVIEAAAVYARRFHNQEADPYADFRHLAGPAASPLRPASFSQSNTRR